MNAGCVRRDSFIRTAALAVVVGCVGASAVGCRSGSWVTKPSWMTFGQKAEDTTGLASAPASGDVQKPSALAKPYPTTSTPEGYALPAATAQAETVPGAAPAAVTYGSTPPAVEPSPPGVPASQGLAASAVGPQVGPYAPSVAAAPPVAPPGSPTASASPSWSAPPLAAVPPAAGDPQPATVSTAPPPWAATPASAPDGSQPERFADARAASPAWTPAPLEPPPADGRYPTSGTSRFSGGAMPATTPSVVPAELPPAVAPPASTLPPSPAAPMRRPDPGYRPGGTSSYRQLRTSLAGDPPAGVQPASYQPGEAVGP